MVKEKRSHVQEDEEIDLHIMVVDVLEARYPCHELVNGTQC